MLKADEVLDFNEDAIIYSDLDEYYMGTCSRCGSCDVAVYNLLGVLDHLVGQGYDESVKNEVWDRIYNHNDDNGPIFLVPSTSWVYARLYNKKMYSPDGLEAALMGVACRKGEPYVAMISKEECVNILINGGMPEEDVQEYLEYNTYGAFVGECTPYFFEPYKA